jgi:hypothetical protein
MGLLKDHGYWDHPYYQSQEYRNKISDAEDVERNRQDLLAQRPTRGALAYARFLMACENDASITGGKGFRAPNDAELFGAYPFLRGCDPVGS